MAKNEMKLLARMTFVADKMVQNMKKCLEKSNAVQFKTHPAIEPENGLMIATDGHILAATKLKDFKCEMGEGVFVVNGPRMLPVEVTKMKGTVTVELWSDGYDETVRVKDEEGATAQLKQEARYPQWRSAMPWSSGQPITVDAKAWDDALKEMEKAFSSASMVRLYGERDSRTMQIIDYNVDTNEEMKRGMEVGWMPYKMSVAFRCKMLRKIMAFQPTAMRFHDSTRAVMFVSDDTLMLLMPMLVYDDDLGMACKMACKIEQREYDRFDLAKWMTAGSKSGECMEKPAKAKAKAAKKTAAADIPQHTEQAAEPTLEEMIRRAAAMLAA